MKEIKAYIPEIYSKQIVRWDGTMLEVWPGVPIENAEIARLAEIEEDRFGRWLTLLEQKPLLVEHFDEIQILLGSLKE